MIERIRNVAGLLPYLRGRKSFDRVLEKIDVLSIGGGKCHAELKVDDDHVDSRGFLHNGMTATIVDCMSGYALWSEIPGIHVSVEIHFSCVNRVAKGDSIIIDAFVNKYGKTMAFLEVVLKNKSTGEVVVKGTHTKYIVSTGEKDTRE